MLRQALEAQRAADTRIAQRVGAAYREAFKEKWPGQCEHILRLIAERLQTALRKDAEVCLPAKDIDHLSAALRNVYEIYRDLHTPPAAQD